MLLPILFSYFIRCAQVFHNIFPAGGTGENVDGYQALLLTKSPTTNTNHRSPHNSPGKAVKVPVQYCR